jgi:endonuclease III
MKEELISKRLIQLGEELLKAPKQIIEFTNDPKADKLLNDLKNQPHAFVLGCIMDRQCIAKKAWVIPYEISKKINGFSVEQLCRLSELEILDLMTKPEPLHRYSQKMANLFYLAVNRIDKYYKGDASRIWSGKPSSAEVVYRFLQFKGVGPKIGSMAVNILVRDFKIPVSDYINIDISPDRHVKRVFSRLGLCDNDNNQSIYKARALNPNYPGVFDFPCFDIGRKWCKENGKICSDCYMNDLCITAQNGY